MKQPNYKLTINADSILKKDDCNVLPVETNLHTLQTTSLYRLIVIVLMALLIPFGLKAQLSWVNPIPQGNNLNAIHYTNSNVGTAVGKFGTIIRTTDAGVSWTVQESGTNVNLNGVFFTDPNNGFAVSNSVVGGESKILRTTDGGVTWNIQNSGTSNHLYCIEFINSTTGIAAGWSGTVLRTTDGGNTWTHTQISTRTIYDIEYLDENTIFAVGSIGAIYFSTDGGLTWSMQSSGVTRNLRGIHFIDSNIGIAVGEFGTIRRTTNRGITWSAITGISALVHFNSLSFSDLSTGVAVAGHQVSGIGGQIFRTTNGGLNWTQINSGANVTLTSVQMNGSVGNAIGFGGKLLSTANGGLSWTSQSTGTSEWLRDVCFVNSQIGYTVGANGTILFTSNGGQTWVQQSSGSTATLYSVSFKDANNGVVVGSEQTILHTSDGGLTWNTVLYNVNGNIFLAVDLYGDIGIAIGTQGYIFRTINGGISWTSIPITIDLGYNINDIEFIDQNTVVAVGDGPSIRSLDGGLTWSGGGGGTDLKMNGLAFRDALNGVAVGYREVDYDMLGRIFRTTDGGISWSVEPINSHPLQKVDFFDANNGMAAGWNGTILFTNNGGLDWIMQSKINEAHMWGIAALSSTDMLAVGRLGNIITGHLENPEFRNLKLTSIYFEAFHNGTNTMNQLMSPEYPGVALYEGLFGLNNVVDMIDIELRDANNYNNVIYSSTDMLTTLNRTLKTDGSLSLTIPGEFSGSYFITVKHRNSLSITSALPVDFSNNVVTYSFNSLESVYGSNLKTMGNGTHVIYSGDINQDGFIDLSDQSDLETNLFYQNPVIGYSGADLNGDAIINNADKAIMESNRNSFIVTKVPVLQPVKTFNY